MHGPSSDTFVQRLGRERLQVISQLGEGAAGTVFRVRDRLSGGMLALKVLRDTSAHAVLRFQREATLAASLQHPCVVRVHSSGVFEGRCFIAYELVEGGRNLEDAFHGASLTRRVELLRDAARGLGHAHARGIVHRDVKPANVLVGDDGRARVTDFGLALTDDAERLTRTGAIVGTPFYMAPEQVDGKRGVVTPATDVWALGIMLYEALTDERPFEGESLMDLASAITSAAPSRPSSVCAVPGRLEDLCLRALSADPAARPADGEAFARELEAWLEEGGAVRSPWRRRLSRAAALAGLLVVGGALAWAGLGAPVAPVAVDRAETTSPEAAALEGRGAGGAAAGQEAAGVAPPPDWRATLGRTATYRVRGRAWSDREAEGVLEWTIAQGPPTLEGDVARIEARISRMRLKSTTFVADIRYDSDDPATLASLAPLRDAKALVGATLAATVKVDVNLRSGAVLRVEGLPVSERSKYFYDVDRAAHLIQTELRPIAVWCSGTGFKALLENVLRLAPADDRTWSFKAPRWWTPSRLLEVPVRASWSPEEQLLRAAVDGPTRLLDREAGRERDRPVSDVTHESAARVEQGRIVSVTATTRYRDGGDAEPAACVIESEFELLR